MGFISDYSARFYCDHINELHVQLEFPHEFTGPNLLSCKRQARAKGWRFHHNGTISCPKCSKGVPSKVISP